jgi:hypothetical protein
MPQQGTYEDPERRSETVDPANPPNSVVRPAVRSAVLGTYLGGIVALFVLVAAAFAYWSVSDRRIAPGGSDRVQAPSAVGTSGERTAGDDTPGGFDPAPSFGSTRQELDYRGGGKPSPGPSSTAPLTSVRDLMDSSKAIEGRRVDLDDVRVDRAEGGAFWIRDGDATAAVVAAGGSPTVKDGQQVDLIGTIEREGSGVRIRASRIDVK